MGESFERDFRITSRSEFEKIYQSGTRQDNRCFRVFVLRDSDFDLPKLGISVSKRVGNAVIRNQLKRRVREWFRKRKDLMGRMAVVIDVKSDARHLEFDELCEKLDRMLASEKTR